ncbi:MAG TPA: HAD family hydrolase [Mesorhizobium sp.]|jgi:phosphoglycolate phosphatase|nr:HAD family hydrolase [Mesorhizobium sp.]
MPAPILVFDLDGTLVDTAPDLIDSLNHCLSSAGIEPATRDGIGFHVGLGSRAMIERAYALRSRRIAAEELERLATTFLQHYAEAIPGRSAVYPRALEMLDRHAEAGFIFAICTNKPEMLAQRLLTALGLASRFAAICGADTFAFRKPDPRHLLETIRLAGGDPERAVMIGDSRTDIATAKAAGIPVIALDFGYSDRPVVEYEPSVVASHFDAISVSLSQGLIHSAAA